MMKHAACAVAVVCLALPSTARADIVGLVTAGEWSAVGSPSNVGPRWFDNESWDYPTNSAGWHMAGGLWEYLHLAGDPNAPVGFGIVGDLPGFFWELGLTAYTDGQLSHDPISGAFTYTAHGFNSNSYDGLNMLLVRRTGALATIVDIWIEDILQSAGLRECHTLPQATCGDYSDAHGRMVFLRTVIIPPFEPPSVPEPTTLSLLGLACLAVGRRLRRGVR